MSLSIYQRHLDDIPTQYMFLKLLRPPLYVIDLSNNQLIAVCYSNGSSKRPSANVTERLSDGLTSIEVKMITAAFFVASGQAKRRVIHTTVSYQGQIVAVNKQ